MAVSTQQIATCESEIRGKIVMVTGASSGIGWEFCIDLAKAGCRIIAAARRTDRLKALCHEINNKKISDVNANQGEAIDGGVLAVAVELDVCADGPTIEATVQKAWLAFGRIDVLINNAGIRGTVQTTLDISEEEWEKTFRTNITGPWLVSKYVCRQMLALNQGGSIINISSISGLDHTHQPGSVAYSSSKSAFNAMTRVMAIELGKHNIRVNSICPGLFKSEITQGLFQKKWANNVISKIVPLRELGNVDPALTSLVRYLICGSSKYVTGNIFTVDAGCILPGTVQTTLDISEEEWEKTFRTNITGPWLVSKYVCRQMLALNQGGSIINISSISGLDRTHLPGSVAYASSKSAFNAMTRVMAIELGKHNIRVNSICPGLFKSKITQGLFQKKWANNVISKIVPLRELGNVDPALTSLVRYLICGSSKYLTGNIFTVDAGCILPGVPIYSSL